MVVFGQDTITESSPYYMFWPHNYPLYYEPDVKQIYEGWPTLGMGYCAPHDTVVYGVSLQGEYPLDSMVEVSLAIKKSNLVSQLVYLDTAVLDSSAIKSVFKFTGARYGDRTIDSSEVCYEVYFRRPWVVRDTFFIVTRSKILLENAQPIQAFGIDWPRDEAQPAIIEMGPQRQPVFSPTLQWGSVYPIVQPDRVHCAVPTGLHQVERGADWVTVAWNGGTGDGYRVRVEGELDTVIETQDTMLTLGGLSVGNIYWVKVQRLCRYSRQGCNDTVTGTLYSTRLGVRAAGNGVGEVEEAGVSVTARRGAVEVSCAEADAAVQVYDMAGRRIAAARTKADSPLLLPVPAAGVYTVRVGSGPAHKVVVL